MIETRIEKKKLLANEDDYDHDKVCFVKLYIGLHLLLLVNSKISLIYYCNILFSLVFIILLFLLNNSTVRCYDGRL